jgi:hypothetical protein
MNKYIISEECGGSDTIEAKNMTDAIAHAKEWVQLGDYGDVSVYVDVQVQQIDEDGDDIGDSHDLSVEVVREPAAPECADKHHHEWESPEWLGGCSQNPGVWSCGGTQIESKSVCRHCGCYQLYVSESTPGQHPRTPERTTYSEADEESRAWVEEMAE